MHRARWAHIFFQSADDSNEEEEEELEEEEEGEEVKEEKWFRGGRRWFCRRFVAAGKQHIILYVARACLGASLVMRVFAYALPTFRLRGAYAGELLYFRILAMQTSRLETLQKRERNSSISFCFSAKQLLSSNYLYFLDSGNFTYQNELHSLDPSFLTHRLHNSSTPRSSTRRLPQNEAKYAYASLRTPANCLHPTMCRSTFI